MEPMSLLADILGSRVRTELFRLFFGMQSEPLHMREVERRTGFSHRPVQQDLNKLADLHLLNRKKSGNRVYFSANRSHPLYPDIRNVVLKTIGLADAIKAALSGTGIRMAWVFGSVAAGTESDRSDVDLIVIGSISLRKLATLLAPVAEKTGREINPHVIAPAEWKERVRSGEHFVAATLKAPKLFIIGSEHELETDVLCWLEQNHKELVPTERRGRT